MSGFTYWMRVLYTIVAWLMAVAVVGQVFLAGMALFVTASYWPTHIDLGYAIGLPVPVLLVLGALGRLPRRMWGLLGLMVLVYMVQTVLPVLRGSLLFVAALHPVNAVLLTWLAVRHARRAGVLVRETHQVPMGVPQPAAEAVGGKRQP